MGLPVGYLQAARELDGFDQVLFQDMVLGRLVSLIERDLPTMTIFSSGPMRSLRSFRTFRAASAFDPMRAISFWTPSRRC